MEWYHAGTVTVTNGSDTVTGSGTSFVGNVEAGEGFVGPGGVLVPISSVDSATQLTLAGNWPGSTASAQAYFIMPTQSQMADLAAAAATMLASFAAVRDGAGAGLFGDGSAAAPGIRFANDQDTGIYRLSDNSLGVAVAGAAAFWVNADGSIQLASGKSMHELLILHTGASTDSLLLRNNSWGRDLRMFAGSTGFTIMSNETGTGEGKELHFGTGDEEWLNLDISGNFLPITDNAQTLGWSTARWSTVYAGTGTINTSDEREKTWRGELTDAEYQAGLDLLGEMGFFQFNDAVAAKGSADARYHFGVRAQRVWAIFADHGLIDPIDNAGEPGKTPYGFLCYDKWEEQCRQVLDADGEPTGATEVALPAGDLYGIRTDELALFLSAVQARRGTEQDARIAALEAALHSDS